MEPYGTKQQRKEIYQTVIDGYYRHIGGFAYSGVCVILHGIVRLYGYPVEFKNTLDLFPEFAAQKPEDTNPNSIWWNFRRDGMIDRIQALKDAIQLCD